MKTLLRKEKGRIYVEIPETFVKLYSLKEGMFFNCKIKELENQILIISLSAKLED